MKRIVSRLFRALLLAAFLSVLPFGFVNAETIPYGTLAGDSITFGNITETSNPGASHSDQDAALFGNPTVMGDRLWFFPGGFYSQTDGSGAETTSSTLNMYLQAGNGTYIETISIVEYGDYTFTGTNSDGVQANVSGALFIADLLTGSTYTDEVRVEHTFTQDADAYGLWSIEYEIDLTGLDLSFVQLSFNNVLQTSSDEENTASFIQKKVANAPSVAIGVNTNPIPIPGAIWLFGSGFGLVAGISRRTGNQRTCS